MSEFPGNSHISKIQPPVAADPAKPLLKPVITETSAPVVEESDKKIVTGSVTKRKKPLGKRFSEMFVVGDDSFAQHILKNVVIPTAKELAITMVTQAGDNFRMMVEQALTGKVRTQNNARPNAAGGPINYNRMSAATGSAIVNRATSAAATYKPIVRHSNQIEDIVLEDRSDGDNVLLHLDALIERQGHCTVGDYYGLVGERPVNTDEQWGWTADHNLASARVMAVRGGYLINFPRPIPIPPA